MRTRHLNERFEIMAYVERSRTRVLANNLSRLRTRHPQLAAQRMDIILNVSVRESSPSTYDSCVGDLNFTTLDVRIRNRFSCGVPFATWCEKTLLKSCVCDTYLKDSVLRYNLLIFEYSKIYWNLAYAKI